MTRKLLITIFFAMAAIAAMAQNTRPFEPLFVERRSWSYWYDNCLHPERNDVYTYTVSGDTIVNGRECKCIVVRSEKGNKERWRVPVYEEDEKSFVMPAEWDEFSPIFDFTVKPGDEVEQKFECYVQAIWLVKNIEENIEVRGHKRRKITLGYPDYPSLGHYWIEGVGSVSLFNVMTAYPILTDGSGYYFKECRQDGEIILTCEDMGIAGIDDVKDDGEKGSVIYDIYGRRVENPQSGHIYIRNGQKFVQR